MSVEVFPAQTTLALFTTVSVGTAVLTATPRVKEDAQPLASLPETVYVVLDAGDTIMDVALEPVLQVYVFTPVATRVELAPAHTELLGLPIFIRLMDGAGNRLISCVAVLVQPAALEPVTV